MSSLKKNRIGSVLSSLSVAFSLLGLLLFVCSILLQGISAWCDLPGPLSVERIVFIRQGSNVRNIATQMEREGVVSSRDLFLLAATMRGVTRELKAGEFLFSPHESVYQVLNRLVEGKNVLHKLTIPEGLTSAQIVSILRENPILLGSIDAVPPEGSLHPQTYKFVRGTTRQKMIDHMRSLQKRIVERVWAERSPDLPLKTPEEMVILASIVEKETGKEEERASVASVFINRLRKSMRLQSDPTIIYGIMNGQGSLGRGLKKSEIQRKTAYNTYKISGLPPTPISNPGLASLESVAKPAKTDFLYFVASGDGGHAFSSTLREHNRNVARWRKINAAQKREKKDD